MNMSVQAYIPPASVGGFSRGRDVRDTPSKSEHALQNTVSNTLDLSAKVRANWQAKVEREGTKVWISPFEARNIAQQFPTKAKCVAYMKKANKMQIEQAKLEKKPSVEYEPRQITLQPPRTLEDLATPQQAAAMRQQQQALKKTADLRLMAMKAAGNELKGSQLVSLPEHTAMQRMHLLSDGELKNAFMLCKSRGRKSLLRQITSLCQSRGINTGI
jgi:protein subunit release factor B